MSSHTLTENPVFGKYITPGNELEDDFLYLKKNDKFVFYRKNILVPIVRIETFKGTYKVKQDTVFLNWGKVELGNIRDWLSHQFIVDSQTKTIHFLDDLSLQEVKKMSLKK